MTFYWAASRALVTLVAGLLVPLDTFLSVAIQSNAIPCSANQGNELYCSEVLAAVHCRVEKEFCIKPISLFSAFPSLPI
jgi:hypothetical protein